MPISRRSFLKSSAAATALSIAQGTTNSVLAEATATKALAPGPGNKWPGKVVVNFNKDAVASPTTIGEEQINVIKQMVDDSIKALSGKTSVGEAWKEIFPSSITKDSKIAIKTNFYATSACRVHWSVLQAMTEGLQQMDFNGVKFPAANITIFEGNVPAANTLDGAGYTETHFPGVIRKIDTFDKSAPNPAKGETNGYATSLMNADFFMNVFGLRGHSLDYAEGVTLGGKSNYGTYSNTSMTTIHSYPGSSKRFSRLMCSGAVFQKQVLSICAGLLSNKKGAGINDSPSDYSTYAKQMDPSSSTKATSTIIMSTDSITTDMQAIKVMQMNINKTWGTSDMPKYLQASAGISGALSDDDFPYNIGIINEKDMNIIKIINGSSTTPIKNDLKTSSAKSNYLLRVSPLGRQGIFHIEYLVPDFQIGDYSVLSIYDILGKLLFLKKQRIQGALNHYTWDGKTMHGKALSKATYVCTLSVGHIKRSTEFTVI